MKLFLFQVLFLMIFLTDAGANESTSAEPARDRPKANPARQVTLKTRSKYPQVRLSSYTLISEDVEATKADAEAVMQVKIELPRAVQTKEADKFDRILARNFVFRANDEFYNRADYIRARVNNKGTVMTADYENVVLQFIGDIAFLTYRNIVVDQPGGPENTAYMTWADILVKEDGKWKFSAVHLIDSKTGADPKRVAR